MVQFAIPKRVNLDDIKNILKAYYVEGAHNEEVSTKSVEDTAQLSDKVGRQTNFFEEVGIIERVGKKRKLTKPGEEVAEALMGGNEEKAKARMREVLTDWEFTSKIQGFVRMQGPVEREQLLEYITANVESDDSRGKDSIVEMLLWANLLEESEEDVYSVAQGKSPKNENNKQKENESETEVKESSWEKVNKDDTRKISEENSKISSISIEFNFTTDDKSEEIIRVIKAARQGLAEDLNNNTEDSSTE